MRESQRDANQYRGRRPKVSKPQKCGRAFESAHRSAAFVHRGTKPDRIVLTIDLGVSTLTFFRGGTSTARP
jgi:hypothetical protein